MAGLVTPNRLARLFPLTMAAEIIWLVLLGIEQRVFTLAQAQSVRRAVGPGADLVDFAQQLIDDGHVTDVGTLEKLAGQAMSKAKTGFPPNNPFDGPAPEAPRKKIAMPSASRPSNPAAPVKSAPSRSAPAPAPASRAPAATSSSAQVSMDDMALPPVDGIVQAAEFDFDAIGMMDDAAVAAGMRGLLVLCEEEGISDLHLSAGSKPFVRRQRYLSAISEHVLTEEESLRLNTALLTKYQRAAYFEQKDYDFALALDATHRYRVNIMFHKQGPAGSYRMVAAKVPRLDDLGLRNIEAIRKMLSYHNGLMLVTGPVGAGKTTTLAALVAELNEARKDHLITVEDPVEIVQESSGCNITQRQIGAHTKSFASALKGALREDPDIIVIGELRDLETIEMAISASETGHLVIGTMHTSDASTTLNRLLDVFPPAQQTQIRASVAESLRGVICQRLLPGMDGSLVIATEILTSNAAVAALVRDGKMQGLRNVMETGSRDGMCLMDNSIFELYRQRKVSAEVARLNILNKQMLAQIR